MDDNQLKDLLLRLEQKINSLEDEISQLRSAQNTQTAGAQQHTQQQEAQESGSSESQEPSQPSAPYGYGPQAAQGQSQPSAPYGYGPQSAQGQSQPSAPYGYGPQAAQGQSQPSAPYGYGPQSAQGQSQPSAPYGYGPQSAQGQSQPSAPYGYGPQSAQGQSQPSAPYGYGPQAVQGQSQPSAPYGQAPQQPQGSMPHPGQAAAQPPIQPYGYPPPPYRPIDSNGRYKENQSLEHVLARVWLPRVFIVVLLLGVLWGFLAIVVNGHLSQEVRCILGVLLGAILYGTGVQQTKKDRAGLGKVLLGGSLGVFILSLSAAHLLYDLISAPVAIILYMAVLVLITYTSLKWRSQTLLVLSTLSGYMIPFLVAYNSSSEYLFIGYQLVFSIFMFLLATRYNYQVAYWFSFGLLHFSFILALALDYTENEALILTALTIQHLVLLVQFIRRKQSNAEQLAMQFVSFLLLAMWANLLYNDSNLYPIMLAAGALIYGAAAYHFMKIASQAAADHEQQSFHRHRVDVSMVIATAAVFLFIMNWSGMAYSSIAVFAEGVLALILGAKIKYTLQKITGSILAIISGVWIITDAPVKIVSTETLGWIVLLAGIAVIYAAYSKWIFPKTQQSTEADGAIGHDNNKLLLSALLWLEAALGLIFVSIIVNLATKGMESDIRHFILSGAWLLYALGAIAVGMIFKLSKARLTGMLFLFVVLMKVILIDVPDVSLSIRAIMFIVLGAVGIAVSRLLYAGKEDASKQAEEETNI
ncbi:DUF2339 domain-containing protein [Paenibacillus sp. GXUN7292]|uniref:DUF2339 domain-containing protein n=1 Tax=Paenibacillus sp. GXUN7292 TaxID=3422499 RepID=UPI003D7D19C9